MQDALAIKQIGEFHQIDQKLIRTWEQFMSEGSLRNQHRPVISSSWNRCSKKQIDPLKYEADIIPQERLENKLEQNRLLLQAAKPYIDQLFQYFEDLPFAVVLADREGVLIDGRYNPRVFGKLERQRFLPGSIWREEISGTNAVGTALKEGKPVQVFAAEHFCQGWHNWVCSASPIRDPFTKQIIGYIDMTAEKELVQAHDLYLIASQAFKIEQALGIHLLEKNENLLHSFINYFHDPLILFDMEGRILRLNDAAKFLLNVKVGERILQQFDPPVHGALNELSQKGMETTYRLKNHFQWRVRIFPYQLGNWMIGGIAIFQQIKTENKRKRSESTRYQFDNIITQDPKMLQLIELAKKAAFYEKTVLITGETGTGKEILAQSIHAHGPRRNGPFVAVNCGAIPKDLIASELFGYEGGAFTGAKSEGNKGKFVSADGGTIFLDEIGELSLEAQTYLLRVLEEKAVVPVGSNRSIPVNVRIIAATHRNLEELVKKGEFRSDLYYRLNVITLTVPALRERKDDIPLLIKHYIKVSDHTGQATIDDDAMQVLKDYYWPGNIRQLKNVVEQSLFLADHGRIRLCNLPDEVKSDQIVLTQKKIRRRKTYELDKTTLEKTLRQTGCNISEAAKILSVSRMTIYRYIDKFDINLEELATP